MSNGAWTLSTQWPIALFPVRLETRFLGTELAIRVIPDTIHADSHEPELTSAELAAGQSYWSQTSVADAGTVAAAWSALASQFGTERASWVARVVRQSTLNSTLPFQPAERSASWTRAPVARALPTRWQAMGTLNNEVTRVTGSAITASVPIGPDPSSGGLAMPMWMRDFATAEATGMGLRLPLTADMQQGGLDLLLVYGVDESGDPAGGAQELSELLDAHYYTDGFSYIPAGTPTTNSATVSAGLDRSSPAYLAAHQVQSTDQPPQDQHSGASVLAAALGISLTENPDPSAPSAEWQSQIAAAAYELSQTGGGSSAQNWADAQTAVLTGVATAAGLASGAALTEEATAGAMNRALWAAGPGYFLSQMLNGSAGEDWKRLDHSNVIADDAYLRYLDRQRLLAEAQLMVIAQATGITNVDPANATQFQDAWNAAVSARQTSASTLEAEAVAVATAEWQQLHPGETFDATGDWEGAAQNLIFDRTSRYAYYRWLARSQLPGPQPDLRLEDWLAGQTAALYGEGTFAAARAHFVSHVRPGGALPAIAIGSEPYGVLIACALDGWQPAGDEQRMRAFVQALLALRDTVWTPCVAQAPQLGPDPISDVTTAQTTLLELLATGPVNQEIYAREHVGPYYVRNLWRFVQMQLTADWSTTTAASSTQLLHDTGIAWAPRLSGLIGAEASAPLTAPVVDGGDQSFGQWLTWLASSSATCAQLESQVDAPGKGSATPLLYRLLRHSALREYAAAAIRIELAAGILGDWEHLEQELIAIGPGPAIASAWDQLARAIAVPGGGSQTISTYLDGPGSAGDPAAADLQDFRAAVGTLAAVETADELERNLRQLIDATSHRLDAWLTSIAHRRLAALRQANLAGVLIGGYGWVENLRPATSTFTSDGFIHAPSVPQAVSAAVLRSGYQSYAGGAANPFAVNLSSSRTRLAARLLDSVRAGQTVGSLTGYDFERNLQESGAGQYTRQFRECAPPSSTVYPPATANGAIGSSDPTSVAQAPSVTDGLVLRAKWQSGDSQVATLLTQIANDDQQRQQNGQPQLAPAVNAALAALGDALDTAADALTAESLHHAINGVPSRAAATLDALARGDGAVPELDLLASPRSGLTIGHRVAFVVPAAIGPQTGWSAPTATQLRAAANPTLEALAQGWLPDPGQVRCSVAFTPSGGQTQTVVIRLSDCDISALDCVYETPVVPAAAGASPIPDLVALAVIGTARTQLGIDATQTPTVTWERTNDFAATELTFYELGSLCRLARALIQSGRALRPADLGPIGTPDTPATDPEITARADAAEATVRSCAAGLTAASPQAALSTAASLGVRGAAYAATVAEPDPALVSSIAATVQDRVAQLDALTGSTASTRDVQRLQAAFGADFLPLPAFTPANATELTNATTLAGQAGWADQPTIRRWLARSAEVRPHLLSLTRLRTAACVLAPGTQPLATVQLPSVAGEPWVADAFQGVVPSGPRVQITLAAGPLPDPTASLAGLVVDDWTESVPDTVPVTGLAYHYQSPLSEPPQAMLLAVPSDLSASTWTTDALEQTLTETLALIKLRAVDQDALAQTGQLLPAFYIANNVAGETISTDVMDQPVAQGT